MKKEAVNIAESIKLAIELEKKGHTFYLEAAEKTTNDTGKALFTRLANEEMIHLATFKRMLDSQNLAADWRNLIQHYPAKPQLPLFDEKAKKSLRPATTDELQALRLAMQQEREAMKFFGSIAENSDQEAVNNIFSFVREQEVYHHDLLQAEYDAILKTGFWFDSPEFRMDGKF